MVRQLVHADYGIIFSTDSKTREIMRIYHLKNITPPNLVDGDGEYVPLSIMSESRYKTFVATADKAYIRDPDGKMVELVFPNPNLINKSWLEKIDEQYLNDDVLNEVQYYNKFVGLISKTIFELSPEPISKGVAGVVYIGSKTTYALILAKKGLNKLRNMNDLGLIDIIKQIESTLKVFDKLEKENKEILDTPLNGPVDPISFERKLEIVNQYNKYFF